MAFEIFDNAFQLHSEGGQMATFAPVRKDESGDPSYFGFLNRDGWWLIVEQDDSAGTIMYLFGKEDFSTNWSGRSGLTYKEFNALFT